MPTLSRDILIAALTGLKGQRSLIDSQIAEVETLLKEDGGAAPSEAPIRGRRGKRSAAVRQKMAEAQRARWAKVKGEEPAEAPKAKRKLSAAGRKAIIAGIKKRWADKKAAEALVAKRDEARKGRVSTAARKKGKAETARA